MYRNGMYNRRGCIHNLYRAEMSALYKGNSQGYFSRYNIQQLSTFSAQCLTCIQCFRTFLLHAAITKQSCRMLIMDAILFLLITPLNNEYFSGVERTCVVAFWKYQHWLLRPGNEHTLSYGGWWKWVRPHRNSAAWGVGKPDHQAYGYKVQIFQNSV